MAYVHLNFNNTKINLYNNDNTINKNNVNNNSNDNIINKNNVNDNSNDKKCLKCNKILSSKSYLKKHIKICKGTSSSLECQICKKIFAFRQSKSLHLIKCKEKNKLLINNEIKNNEIKNNEIKNNEIKNNEIKINEIKINEIKNNEIKNNEIKINDNLINEIIKKENYSNLLQNNNINFNIINNNITNNNNIITNINLIAYNKEDEKIEFDISHLINKDIIYKISTRDTDNGFTYFSNKLFENKNNQMIIKSNLKNKYSNIHLGMNIWEKILDDYIYPIIMSHIAETMLKYIGNNKKLNNLIDYLNIMASNGYSNENTNEYKRKYKINIEKLKLLFNSFK